jgi:hypothetical protein
MTDPSLAIASVALCFLFPPFIERLTDQGAEEEVIDRLRFVSSLNSMRVSFASTSLIRPSFA